MTTELADVRIIVADKTVLIDVYEWDRQEMLEHLYLLLGKREAHQNISHQKMPNFWDHVKFVDSKPYKAWYLITESTPATKVIIGTTYITNNNEVGIFLYPKEQHKGYGNEALTRLRELHAGPLLAHINPSNEVSKVFFLKNGFKLIQYTYQSG